mmetsp:Transcript_10888/g.14668  ORF Transcript_10888/g.14668 Transcript_10888/m.14668 type:complete len:81 (-) Transcript_10888:848-1090(-)
MNVSEHSTRAKYRQEKGSKGGYRVIGIMLGKQSGRTVEIMNTFETKFENKNPSDGTAKSISIDMDFTQRRVTGYAEMFPD